MQFEWGLMVYIQAETFAKLLSLAHLFALLKHCVGRILESDLPAQIQGFCKTFRLPEIMAGSVLNVAKQDNRPIAFPPSG